VILAIAGGMLGVKVLTTITTVSPAPSAGNAAVVQVVPEPLSGALFTP
jgi:hypothetical protein